MSESILSNIGSTPIDLLSLVRTPANSKVMLCFSNESSDDGVIIEQSFTSTTGGDDKVVVNRLGRGKCLSIMHTDDASILLGFTPSGLNIRTLTADSYVSLILASSTYIPDENTSYDISTETGILVYFLSVVKLPSWYLSTKVDKKQEVYLKSNYERSQATQFAPCDALEGSNVTKLNLIPNRYTMYSIAARGFRCRDITGTPSYTFAGAPQGGSTSFDFNGLDQSTGGTIVSNVRLYEIPYKPTSSVGGILSYLSSFVNATQNSGVDISTGFTPDYNAMFMFEPSIWLNDKIRPLNFVGQSGVSALGTISQSYIEFDNPDDLNSLKASTPMVKVTQNSEEHFDLVSFSNDKIKSFAVDIKTLSRNYPYSVAFSSPIMTGITFKSDTEILVHIKDRTTKFNYDHFGKLLRFAVGYDSVSNKLWINGVEQNLVSQGTVAVGSTAITKVGLDVKDAGITATEYVKPTDNAMNIGGLVLFASILNQTSASKDFEYAKVWRDFYDQTPLTSTLITDLSQIDYWIGQVNS